MNVGLLGLPGSGKTTLFNALTGAGVSGYHDRPNVGVAAIPDPRLQTIATYVETKKIVPASLHLVDIPGVAPSGEGGADAKKLNALLEHVRKVDAIAHVVRCFDATASPADDIEQMNGELILADLIVAESAKDRAERPARAGDKDARSRVAVLETVLSTLENDQPIRSRTWTDPELAVIRSYGFVTARPMLYVANVAESHIAAESAAANDVKRIAERESARSIAICAKLESELAELDESDRDEMLESLGLSEPAIGPLARSLHEALGLTTFYTAGPKEVRAWAVSQDATAPQAAGVIHSDIQRGFIRAETYSVDDLVQHRSEKAIREAGRLRVEGKGYRLQDGDVVHFLFNV